MRGHQQHHRQPQQQQKRQFIYPLLTACRMMVLVMVINDVNSVQLTSAHLPLAVPIGNRCIRRHSTPESGVC